MQAADYARPGSSGTGQNKVKGKAREQELVFLKEQGRQRRICAHSILEPSSSTSASSSSSIDDFLSQARALFSSAASSPVGIAALSIGVTLCSSAVYWRYLRRIKNAEYLTPGVLKWRRMLVGRCTSVGDGDGFRLYHQPGPPFLRNLIYPVPKKPSALKNETLSIRLAGADAPESGHFGQQTQPYAKEAKEYLKKRLEGRTVWVEVGHVDQYKRLVATPYIWDAPYLFGRTNISVALVRAGLAVVYRSTGADYGSAGWFAKTFFKATSGEMRLELAERRAQSQRIGIWSLKNFESPEAYKKRVKGSSYGTNE